jgi:hypothetical protein
MNRSQPKAWGMEMSQITDEVTRIEAMAVEYRAAYSAGDTERLRIICQRIDEQYREQCPEAATRTDNPGMVEALEITGRKPNYELRKMVDCLETLPPTNTVIDNQTLLDATKTVLRIRSGKPLPRTA